MIFASRRPASAARIATTTFLPAERIKWRLAVLFAALCVAYSPTGIAAPPDAPSAAEPTRVLVMPRAGLPDAEFGKILKAHGGRSVGQVHGLPVHVVELPSGAAADAVAEAISRNPHIKFAEPDRLVAPDLVATDPYYGYAWHLPKIQSPLAWDVATGTGVTVAVLDTGVNAAHPDLQGQLVAGWNFYDNNSNTSDVYGHGTLVAGVVAAQANNGLGVTSVAWNAKVMPIRVSDVNGYGSWSAMASGLTWAADRGARVANISYMVHSSSTVQSAAQYMRNKGGVVVTAAGNTGAYDSTPASDALVTVSATDSADAHTSWSTYGPYVDLAAPGVGIWSTDWTGGYSAVSGTSFASPVTAGVVALMLAANPALAPADVVGLLESTAVDLGSGGYDQLYGFGRVNAGAAVQSAVQFVARDTTAPSAAITSPTSGASVSGIVPIDVKASDNVGVARVDLLVNGAVVASDTSAPFQFSWDSTALAAASASLVARAVDAAGNQASSATINVAVVNSATGTSTAADTIAPTVRITSPVNGAKVSGQVTIGVIGSDNVAVKSLLLYVDNALVATGNVGTVSYKWNASKASAGSHAITAVAQDAAGNRSTVTVNVTR